MFEVTEQPLATEAALNSLEAEHHNNITMIMQSDAQATLLPPSPSSVDQWETPQEINSDLLPVPPFPVALLPSPLSQWIEDLADRMRVPLDCAAVGAMVVAASLIGTACGIRPKQNDDWLVVPNLFGAMVLPPGKLKSPVLKAVTVPISGLESLAETEYEELLRLHNADQFEFEARQKALQDEINRFAKSEGKPQTEPPIQSMDQLKQKLLALQEPPEPTQKRYLTNNCTMEKLHELLATNQRGLLILRDELAGFLAALSREDKAEERAFFLEGFNGTGRFTFDRIGRGTIHVKNLCLSLFGGIQPDKLKSHLVSAMNSGNNDGLVQRFQLMVYPDDIEWSYIDRTPNAMAQETARHVFIDLANANFTRLGATIDEVPYFRFDHEGQDLFKAWLTDLEQKLRQDDHPILIEHLAKYRSLMPSIALIDHLINSVSGQCAGTVTVESARRAAAWCDFLEAHARRIYGLVTNSRARARFVLC